MEDFEKLETLIAQMKQKQQKEAEIRENYKKNLKTTLLAKMPKLIILNNILDFLPENDIVRFASISRSLRQLVYSPMGLKIILCSKQKSLAMYFQQRVIDRVSMNKRPKNEPNLELLRQSHSGEDFRAFQQMAQESTKEDQLEELQTLKDVKGFLTKKLLQSEEISNCFQKDIFQLNQDLQREKRENKDMTEKYLQLANEREDHQENIRELNLKYKNVFLEREGIINKLKQENCKLKRHTKVMAQEVYKQRDEMKKMVLERDQFREALIKIKNSFYQTNVFSQLKQAVHHKD